MPERDDESYIRLMQDQIDELPSNREMLLFNEHVMVDKFRMMREERGWSQKDLADEVNRYGLDFHQSTIAKLETHKRPLRVAEMYALSYVFKMPPAAVYLMAHSSLEFNGLDELTRLMEIEERHRAYTRDLLMEQLSNFVDSLAESEIRMKNLADTMRRVASRAAEDGPHGVDQAKA
ncbi:MULTISPECIES: helix-turn-helix transcriptional regulator [Microbacterium]|uniref:helix-turn-helix domain-containing protein n=1 Tax=Microbacterium TaxID=33882 RepID=UPI002787873F|nr:MULTISPECIES: helix-turn-helix transcriptional regulator [Microbacterium]MDQ1084193.1 transcriptional regulator with XRE-family HTH domain [Microbacterium sp. SORGH_AS_0344]MDQ1170532.1 transcriptional regulator with XRE-family HTH domain [Microbacterium proteolyticum]